MPGRPIKEFESYLVDGGASHVDHNQYVLCPASAFLKYTLEAKSAVDLCIRHFPKNNNQSYSKASQDSLEHLVSAMLPAVLGHFETYQRYLFAGIFDRSVHLTKFDVAGFFKKLEKVTSCSIDLTRLAAHRGLGAKSIGLLLADSVSGWHNPKTVNAIFDAFGLSFQLFSNDDSKRLLVLWQLRHSLVHTGGTITLADAQKVSALSSHGNRTIVFDKQFIFEVSRKLHLLIKNATNRIETAFIDRLLPTTTDEVRSEIKNFLLVHSSVSVWLR